ncbi:MAG: type II toxin-antitoxin system RelE/ParE family toxin [Veillonellales bacterium]
MMNLEQKPLFKRTYKKIYKNQRPQVNSAIKVIVADPLIGEEKKGDLAGVRVYKFDIQNQLYLLAYTVDETTITLLALGVYENFYRELKK